MQPSTSATATPIPTGPKTTGPGVRPGEKPPVLDAIAKEHSSTGAIEFAVYYIKALDWSLATTDPYLLKQISAPSCKACAGYIKALGELAAHGGSVRGGRIRFRSSRLFDGPGDRTADYVVEVSYTQEPLTRVFPTASPSKDSTKPTSYHSHVFVSWAGTGWHIVEEESSS
jgi:hypothetical protein